VGALYANPKNTLHYSAIWWQHKGRISAETLYLIADWGKAGYDVVDLASEKAVDLYVKGVRNYVDGVNELGIEVGDAYAKGVRSYVDGVNNLFGIGK
jgi:hypothetical protein